MEILGQMGRRVWARQFVSSLLLACAAGLAWGQAANAPASSQSQESQSSQQPQAQAQAQDEGTSSSVHHKKNSGSVHHTTVQEEVAPAPELAQAEDLIQKQKFAAAEPLLRKALSDDPANYVAWFDLGFAENGLGKRDDSIAAYRKSVAAKADVFESNLNLGLQLAKAGQPDAEHYLRAATQLKPTSHVAEGQARAWVSLAHVLEASKPEEAIAAYQKAAELQPKDPEPHLSVGLVLEKQQKSADAEREYKQALALGASGDASTDALTGLANIYMRGHRLAEAEAALRKLVATSQQRSDTGMQDAKIQLGRVLAAEGKYDDAIAQLEPEAKRVSGDASLQRDLADLYALAKKNDQAEGAYRGLLTGNPNDATLHQGLGKALVEEKKFAEAEKEFLTAVKIKPESGEVYGDLAFAAGENKDYPTVIKALDVRVKYLPEEAITYFLRASAYDHLKDVKRASANYHLFLNVAGGKYPEQEWQAKHRLIAIEPKK